MPLKTSATSPIELVDYQIREFSLVISKADDYSEDAALGLDFEFLQHETDQYLYLTQLNLSINADVPPQIEVLLRMNAELEGYIHVPPNLSTFELRRFLVHGTEMIYNTFRGTLASILGQTAAKDYILPCADFDRIAGM